MLRRIFFLSCGSSVSLIGQRLALKSYHMRLIFNLIISNEGLNSYGFEQYVSEVSAQICNSLSLYREKRSNFPPANPPLVQSQIGESPENEPTSLPPPRPPHLKSNKFNFLCFSVNFLPQDRYSQKQTDVTSPSWLSR